tara:strand:- start:615 stop:1505 length:891 start_codon:yes stop_codon:yes gene_type:complete
VAAVYQLIIFIFYTRKLGVLFVPEGPEIKRAADQIAAILDGKRIDRCFIQPAGLRRYGPILTGAHVEAVRPRGKALLTRFDNGLTLYSHNQLYGRWYTTKRDKAPSTNRSLRIALHTDSHSAWLYSASEIEILDDDALHAHPFLQRLGPDILDPNLHWRDILYQLQSPSFKRRSLASLYLDQHFIAGIGNYLRTEILFLAGLSPWARPVELSLGQLGTLARCTLAIAYRAYQTGGITNPAKFHARLKKQGQRKESYRFAAFDRDGRSCYQCRSTIKRVEISARRLYFCQQCQHVIT